MAADQPIISVIIGAQNARQTIIPCLNSVVAQAKSLHAEIIVADGSSDGTADVVEDLFPGVLLLRARISSLVPYLWGQAISRARAPIVAITTAHCIPDPDWLANILRLADTHPQAGGIGGPIEGPEDGSAMDWAMYFSRYAAYMPPVVEGPAEEIPGDNAAYRMRTLEHCWIDRENGFWETLVHREMRTTGEHLYISPDVSVRLGHTSGARTFMRARFRHGRHYGSTRPVGSTVTRLARIAAAPALMPLLLVRSARRVNSHRPDWRGRYLRAVPWLILFLAAWSCGEAAGYLRPGHVRP